MPRDCWWYYSDWTCERFSFWPHQGLTQGLWISSPALYHCATATSGFHLWQFQVFNSGAEGMVVVLFWLDLWEIFFLATPGFDLGTSGSLVLHSTTVPTANSGFQLWQFQVFNSGAEGLVVVLFWLDLWEIFFLATPGFEPGTSGSLVLHSTTVPQWLLVFTSDNFRYLTSGAEGLVVVLFWLDLWEIFFLATPGFELGTSGSLVLHSTTVPQWLLVFTSDNFRYLTLVQRDCWWYCSDWNCERFFSLATPGFELGTSGSLVLHSTTVPQWRLVFTSDYFRYLTLVQRIGGGIVLIGPVRDFLFGHNKVSTGTLHPLVLHSTTVPQWLLVFTSDNFRYLNSGAEGLLVVLFWLDLWEIFFWPHQGLTQGPLDL